MLDDAPDDTLLRATGLDAQALRRQARRLAQAAQPPWLAAQLAARMAERLDWIKLDVREVVQWQAWLGGGDAALRRRYPQAAQVWAEDVALSRAGAQLKPPWWQPWRASAARLSAPDALPPGQAQLLWANLGLHGASALGPLFARWHAALAVDGFLLFSCLGPDSFIELRQLYQREGWGAVTPQWVDLHDLGDLLVETGFAEPVMDMERLTLTWPDADALWRDLAALGGNLHAARFAGWRTPRWRARWRSAAEASLRRDDGRLALTLEFVCGHALKPAPRLALAAETRFGLDAMREALRQGRGGLR